jgi:hypothetical protein
MDRIAQAQVDVLDEERHCEKEVDLTQGAATRRRG